MIRKPSSLFVVFHGVMVEYNLRLAAKDNYVFGMEKSENNINIANSTGSKNFGDLQQKDKYIFSMEDPRRRR